MKEQELFQRLNYKRCLTPNILPIRNERNPILRDFIYINKVNVIREKIKFIKAGLKREKNINVYLEQELEKYLKEKKALENELNQQRKKNKELVNDLKVN